MPELLEWSLLRVTARAGFKGICAAGIRSNHPHEESRMVVTSRVLSVSEDRRRLLTEHTNYDLLQELPEPPEDHRRHHVWLLHLKARRQSIPDCVEWLRPDGSVLAAADRPEIEAIINAQAAVSVTRAQARQPDGPPRLRDISAPR